MAKQCPICSESNFRLSRLRAEDFWRLVFLMYPLRCQECLQRTFVFLPMAILYKFLPATRVKPQKA
jgi:hypothetical protein